MRRIAALLVGVTVSFACAPLMAGLTVKVAINFDGTVDTRYRAGEKPQTPAASCSTWTCTTKGNATGEINEDGSDLTITAGGSNDASIGGEVQNIAYAYQLRTSGDAQVTALIPSTWTGHLEDWSGFGAGFTEGTAADDWDAYCYRHHNGRLYFKYGTPGSDIVGIQGPTVSLPLYCGVTFVDSTNTVTAYYSTDGEDWFEIGTTTRDLSNYLAWVGGSSHEVSATTTATLTAAYSTTITISAEEPEPPSGEDHLISTGTSSVNCTSLGVEPGDTITLDGTSRGNLLLTNCNGTESAPITVRNDTTESAALTIAVTGNGYPVRLHSSEWVVIDGTGGWSGGSNTDCGGEPCGIRIEYSSGAMPVFLVGTGSSRNYTIKGVEIDGEGQTSGAGIGFLEHDPTYQAAGFWREGITLENMYIHHVRGECMYVGVNWFDDLPRLRNITIRNNRIDSCGWDGIELKSALEGTNVISGNVVTNVNTRGDLPATGNGAHCISAYETLSVVIDGNYCEGNGSTNRAGIIAGYNQFMTSGENSPGAAVARNNIVVGVDGQCIASGRGGSGNQYVLADLIYNTCVNTDGLNIGSGVPAGGSITDNIVAPAASISGPSGTTVENNRTGTVMAQVFNCTTSETPSCFHLTASSPARNQGSSTGPSTDFDGDSRPQEGTRDQGADEYAP